ncbi:non-histone chromosomal protein HMG-like isoform X2 [Paramormyrops kingsleyae]|uniref:non-histone chromosomal protein HMG-like isoform X2 n=1 Tax=Paramormyrops kingsleyae TaxID=1676925 RepID=UPI000CD6380B|nr:non-histone chromosomal protein HMG-14-like isoform X2 [Paramormyrops kingsleyae]
MPKRNKANNDTEAKEPKRRSERLINKAPAKPKKTKDAEKAKPEEKKEETPAENGEAKTDEGAPATENAEKQKEGDK